MITDGPTRERLQHGESAMVDTKPDIDTRTGQRRLAKAWLMKPRIDVLYDMGAITWPQKYAADWWREQHEAALGLPRLSGDYGQSNGARGSGDPSPLPLSAAAERARDLRDAAKTALSVNDRLAVEEACERVTEDLDWRSARLRLDRWRRGLTALAVHLKVMPRPY